MINFNLITFDLIAYISFCEEITPLQSYDSTDAVDSQVDFLNQFWPRKMNVWWFQDKMNRVLLAELI